MGSHEVFWDSMENLNIKSGVEQECILSPIRFLMVLDLILSIALRKAITQ